LYSFVKPSKHHKLEEIRMKKLTANTSDFILYTSQNGDVRIDVFLKNETVWLTQKSIAELFGVNRPAITKHLQNIFGSSELNEDSVSSVLEHTAEDENVMIKSRLIDE